MLNVAAYVRSGTGMPTWLSDQACSCLNNIAHLKMSTTAGDHSISKLTVPITTHLQQKSVSYAPSSSSEQHIQASEIAQIDVMLIIVYKS